MSCIRIIATLWGGGIILSHHAEHSAVRFCRHSQAGQNDSY